MSVAFIAHLDAILHSQLGYLDCGKLDDGKECGKNKIGKEQNIPNNSSASTMCLTRFLIFINIKCICYGPIWIRDPLSNRFKTG